MPSGGDFTFGPFQLDTRSKRLLRDARASEIGRARLTFEQLIAGDGRKATFRVGLANACVLQFEATRADPVPNLDALQSAANASARSSVKSR